MCEEDASWERLGRREHHSKIKMVASSLFCVAALSVIAAQGASASAIGFATPQTGGLRNHKRPSEGCARTSVHVSQHANIKRQLAPVGPRTLSLTAAASPAPTLSPSPLHAKRWRGAGSGATTQTGAAVSGAACWCPGCLFSAVAGASPPLRASVRGGPEGVDSGEGASEDAGTPSDQVSELMISALKGYKAFVSPLLPPACRFLPTCSIYSMEAIRQFGPSKGAVLTAWRLVRCNPLHWAGGGRGYDPPTWPPVGYNYASSADALKQELAALLEREHAQQQRP